MNIYNYKKIYERTNLLAFTIKSIRQNLRITSIKKYVLKLYNNPYIPISAIEVTKNLFKINKVLYKNVRKILTK